ncbi:DUF2218 domain-containing protein [Microbispora sp. GKU 823]|uniref:DUF2218 domain-containing protein n=1 Tax=Microbispora sp. GKU 823 TaxID=1652100 RepID=UPI00117F5FD2|nr:DUF2218 domain-containing protein [Microbispora sp. GKU 823]
MPHSTAYVVTDRPERYIRQLVSHMGHKAETVLGGDGRAVIELRSGRCVLRPCAGGFEMIATAAAEEALLGVRDVVTRHLLRFATQEELVVDWSPPVGGRRGVGPVPPSWTTTCSRTALRWTRCCGIWWSGRGRRRAARPVCRSRTTRAPC